MSEVTLTIDGRKARVPSQATVLEAAERAGVEVPALCYDPRLEPFTSCWLCVVEVEGARGPVPACTARVAEGMVVRTHTEEVARLRRLALELLLSAHYADCVAPCQRACPAGIDVQGFIALIADRQYDEALKLIKETNPFPAVCGRVCPRFCEDACRRNLVDEPVAINWLKRFVADLDLEGEEGYVPTRAPATGRRVAVVGAGPGGLSCAFFLARNGHSVTVLEAKPDPGGMLRFGIPAYRLPREVLRREIGRILALGVELRCRQRWGRDFTLAGLRREGYQAVFVSIGAGLSHALNLPGEELPGVYPGVEFLDRVAAREHLTLGDRVVVVGGGNTAVDAARTARRLGARLVTILYRRSRTEMPAHEDEVREAEAEGVRLELLAAPVRFLGDGRLEAVECVRMRLGEPDATGRRRPLPIDGSEFTVPADTVVLAIGQHMDQEPARSEGGVPLSRYGYVQVEEGTWQVPGTAWFAGGDCVSGAATVVEAIGAGRRAAEAIDRYLRGEPLRVPEPVLVSKGELEEIDPAEYAREPRKPRQPNPTVSVSRRLRGFEPVEVGFDEEAALREAERCLACGCLEFYYCTLRQLAQEYGARPRRFAGLRLQEPVDDRHRLLMREPSKCILCGRCVRACGELAGVGVLGFVGRGAQARIEPEFGLSLEKTACTVCGLCVGACPTGALSARVSLPKPPRWETTSTLTTCGYCGVGCTVELRRRGRRLVRARAPFEAPVNQGSLCGRGIFGWEQVHSARRMGAPLVRRRGRLREASWDEALEAAARGMKRALSEGGPEEVGLLAAPWWTNEALWLLRRLAGEVLGTPNVFALAPSLRSASLARFRSDGSVDDLDGVEAIFLVGVELTRKYPVLAVRARQSARRGVEVAVVGPQRTGLEDIAAVSFRPRAAAPAAALLEAAVGGGRGVGSRAVGEVWRRADRRLLIVDLDRMGVREAAVLQELRCRFAAEVLVLALRGESNAQGAAELGLGGRPQGGLDARRLLARCRSGDLRAAMLLGLASTDGAPPIRLRRKPEFLVVVDAVESPLSKRADVVLPGAFWMEDEGTFLNPERRLQRVSPALGPPGGRTNWEVVAALARALGKRWRYRGPEDVFSQLAGAAGWPVGRYDQLGTWGTLLRAQVQPVGSR